MIKKLAIFVSILTLFLVLAIPNSTKAATGNVSVTLPAFEVELNGIKHNSETMKYPFLTYKDITYVPMTWTMSLVTGLQLQWSGEEGLSVYKSRNPFAIKPELETGGNFKKGRAYNAQVVPFAVTVNGQSVNNASQLYPLLVFQDITYFPLTWTYAVENFGWNLNWDAIQGFKVGSDQRSYMGSLIHEDEQHYYVGLLSR
ncbi:hypothetical protein [Paenibacillus agricola]|uniref:Copper amine oxidase-like N-terminal domain-containing protein n=1 Tax=Paenibacillus agricola TaxID=2716264 RepID=A0ABX0JEL6_9BACL|nr:hypothetical protein [Paenibacillus agricola]NHN34987.1 hypothetical protein [Paenibacillus agricola]